MTAWTVPLDNARWRPEQCGLPTSTYRLAEGQIVIWERRPYRLLGIREREQEHWPDAYRNLWLEHGMPDPATWYLRPMAVALQPELNPDGDRVHLLARADAWWYILPEHFSVCRLCQEIPPCSHVHNETVMSYAMDKLERDMALMPGTCHGCRGPISSRQKTIAFEGENLIRPDFGDGTAIFHLRRECRAAAESYDKRWVAAVDGRRRKLFCEGHASHHHDGTTDCTEGALCPGNVSHRSNEYHSPAASRVTAGCWCVSGDLTARIEQQMRDGEVSPSFASPTDNGSHDDD